ncbi:cobalt-precorrin 5A hydrolase [Pseudobutyrivibrio xylanivorans]|uniref:Cobalt-precorrin 5A acetaldehyde-lyase n=1 Tax=Pseudobutyrivibrio xylanivorans TaxID=185007 RepID=A0A1G5RZT0_PSEXY|nr:cobalamin biosynthesis protein [Pseudobutyrivibrio xylanivorans]SCZ79368.1 cobalt-precorrin 5A acetaldehyde-lyase [Pseudobutyrivibrio xylanivorans]
MKIIKVVYFTENGKMTLQKLKEAEVQFIFEEKEADADLKQWTKEAFEMHLPILFIGATGIAVRTIAPFVESKLTDSSVLVMDELGKNVIPILSGHFGGANEIATEIAALAGANAIITTATDINNVFAVDVFAKVNGLKITDKDKIKIVSSKVLKGEKLKLTQTDDAIEIDELRLEPKRLVLGMGCKKDKPFEDLKAFLNEFYTDQELKDNLYAICSIDVKERETGLIKLAQYYGAEFLTFSAEELKNVPGKYQESDFVNETVGVGNVCERAAVLGAGKDSTLIKNKIAKNGMTFAEARREKIDLKMEKKWQDIFI